MPITTGTSIRGLQKLGNMVAAQPRNFTIILSSSSPTNRLVYRGVVLFTFPQVNGAQPVGAVWKLYGNGLVGLIGTEIRAGTGEIWVNWFDEGLAWQCNTP